jgi:hypothetical protein
MPEYCGRIAETGERKIPALKLINSGKHVAVIFT